MKQKILFFLCFTFSVAAVQAQAIKYTEHLLEKGETLSMLAEKYHSTVGDIMRLNGMHANSVLATGQKIKIPKTTGTESKVTVNTTPPVKTPVVVKSSAILHTVEQGETLYAISKKYGVTVDDLKQWNNIPDLNIEIGEQLAVSSKGIDAAAAIKKAEQAKTTTTIKDTTSTFNKPFEEKVAVQQSGKKTEVKNDIIPVKKNTTVIVSENSNTSYNSNNAVESFFSKDYVTATKANQLKIVSGDAMTFKTASGWTDKKYYILMNDAPTGTIVKITAENGKSIYAKVLWQLEEMKMNQSLGFRISESAAAALSITFVKFPLTVEYQQ